MLTYEQQLDLVQRKLATAKTVGNLTTFKYARRVMYDYLWGDYPELLECRGHTYDNTNGKLVLAAPRKSFNYLENGTWDDVPDDQPVIAYKKFNGFMATASMYNGELVVGTTGTTGSDYAKMARKHIEAWMSTSPTRPIEEDTVLFEIVDDSDPHIVDEPIGAHLLGFRNNSDGYFFPVSAHGTKAKECSFGQLKQMMKGITHEGFMVYKLSPSGDVMTDQVCKLKSPYYVGKKKLMRMNKEGVNSMYNRNFSRIPEDWHHIAEDIVDCVDKDTWLTYTDQERRAKIERFKESY